MTGWRRPWLPRYCEAKSFGGLGSARISQAGACGPTGDRKVAEMDAMSARHFYGEILQPIAVVAFAHHGKLYFWPARKRARKSCDECIHPFIAFAGKPAAHSGMTRPVERRRRAFERREERLRIPDRAPREERERARSNFLMHDMTCSAVLTRRKNQIGAPQRAAPHGGKRLPADFKAVSADDGFMRGAAEHGLGDGRQVGMPGERRRGGGRYTKAVA